MAKGFDCTWDTEHYTGAIKATGYSFVCRYTSHSAWKNITKEEALALSKAGIYIVNVWETAGDHPSFFTYQQGLIDGAGAIAYAEHLGQPHNSPIYFAVDDDLPYHGGVQAYFKGVNDKFKQHGILGQTIYSMGVYGSGHICQSAFDDHMVTFTWLAQSMGWEGSKEYTDWNIKQSLGAVFHSLQIDPDTSAVKGGGGFLVKA